MSYSDSGYYQDYSGEYVRPNDYRALHILDRDEPTPLHDLDQNEPPPSYDLHRDEPPPFHYPHQDKPHPLHCPHRDEPPPLHDLRRDQHQRYTQRHSPRERRDEGSNEASLISQLILGIVGLVITGTGTTLSLQVAVASLRIAMAAAAAGAVGVASLGTGFLVIKGGQLVLQQVKPSIIETIRAAEKVAMDVRDEVLEIRDSAGRVIHSVQARARGRASDRASGRASNRTNSSTGNHTSTEGNPTSGNRVAAALGGAIMRLMLRRHPQIPDGTLQDLIARIGEQELGDMDMIENEANLWRPNNPGQYFPNKPNESMGVIMVFYPQPILEIALYKKGLSMRTTGPDERLEVLDYEYLKRTTMEHISSFINNPLPEFGQYMPEIVHSGLGLGYDKARGLAINPKNGTPIWDSEVILDSRLDRAMIEVALELRQLCPSMVFSSCTRLSDVYLEDPKGEYIRDLQTGKAKPKLKGDKGIAAQLRALHGGMYPQSDIVVADDPIREIAARTWIDEYARMDRSQLMTMTYDDWLSQRPDVKAFIDWLNDGFLTNTVGRMVTPPGYFDPVYDSTRKFMQLDLDHLPNMDVYDVGEGIPLVLSVDDPDYPGPGFLGLTSQAEILRRQRMAAENEAARLESLQEGETSTDPQWRCDKISAGDDPRWGDVRPGPQ